MTDVLIQLIEDVGILGQEMTELILEQFDTYDKVKKRSLYNFEHEINMFLGIEKSCFSHDIRYLLRMYKFSSKKSLPGSLLLSCFDII